MKGLLIPILLSIALGTKAQNTPSKTVVKNGVSYTYVEQMPQPGYDLPQYIAKNIHGGDSVQSQNIQGASVVLKFLVNENGSISDISIVRCVNAYYDDEVVKLVRNMPNWKPGRENGKPVKVWFTLPISIHF